MLRQQGWVNVQRAKRRHVKCIGGQEQAIRRHQYQVRLQRYELLPCIGISTQRCRLEDGQAPLNRSLLYRGRCKASTATGAAVRLRIDADDSTSRVQKRYECGHGERGRPHENNPQWRQFMSISSHRIAPTHSTLRTPIRYCGSALRHLS